MKHTLLTVIAVAVLTAALLTTALPGFTHGLVCGFRASSGLGWLDAYRDAQTAVERLEWLETGECFPD